MTLSYETVKVPEIGLSDGPPPVPREEYSERVRTLRDHGRRLGYDVIVVYGDREHASNLMYLSGFDPRFEEAVLILNGDQNPCLILGNEGMPHSALARLDVDRILCQSLSLLGQDRTRMANLVDALRDAGVAKGQQVGLVGWKYFSPDESAPVSDPYLAVPQFVIGAVEAVVGDQGHLHDATQLLLDPFTGLKTVCSPAQVAELEYGAALASEHARRAIDALEPGITEFELTEHMRLNGYPETCHPMVISGRDEFISLRSPTAKKIRLGDAFLVAVGLWGGLSARGGLVAESEDDLGGEFPGYVNEFAGRYFRAIKCWYETVRVGMSGAELFHAVTEELRGAPFRLALNPGHLTHYDEWVHSPVAPDNNQQLVRSGLMLQCDMIPVADVPFLTCNVEDTVCLGDEAFRQDLFTAHPDLAHRVTLRRQFLQDQVGICPSPDVIPLSNMPGLFSPLLLKKGMALSFKA